MALKLGPEHNKAISYLAQDKRGGLTYQQIAEECGVHYNTLANWRKDPVFEAELKRQITRNTQEDIPALMKALVKHGMDGNAAAAKLVLTANGMLTDRLEVSTEVKDGKSREEMEARIAAYKARNTTEE